jgi:hypothetical protein
MHPRQWSGLEACVRARFVRSRLIAGRPSSVSGTSFLTTLLIARSSDAGQLGVYAVGISLLGSLAAFQDSLYFAALYNSDTPNRELWKMLTVIIMGFNLAFLRPLGV